MSPRIAAIVLVCLAAGTAHAGSVAVWDNPEDGHQTTFYQSGDRLRAVDFGDMGPDAALLFDAGTKRIVALYTGSQAYFDLNATARDLHPQLKRFKALAARMATPPPAIDVHYLPLNEKRTIAGLPCVMYDRFENGVVTREACYIDPATAPGLVQGRRLLDDMVDTMLALVMLKVPAGKQQKVTGDQSPPGLGIWVQVIGPDRKRGDVAQLRSFETKDLPDELFTIPADYHQVAEPLNPPRDGAARQRALNLSRMSPRGEEAPLHEAPSGSWRIVGLAAAGILLFAFLFQALLLNIASQWVLPEARFANAVMATGALWLVVVPLEVFGVWLPAEIVLGGLAAFAGIKVAYRTTTERALLLMVVTMVLSLVIAFLYGGGLAKSGWIRPGCRWF